MNLRMQGQMLRFRVSKEELETLCGGSALTQRTYLPDSRVLEIIAITDSIQKTPLRLEMEEYHWVLKIAAASAQALLTSLPNREGIEQAQDIKNGHILHLSLEVDIRTQKRKYD